VNTITLRFSAWQWARSVAAGLALRGHGIATWMPAAVFVLGGIAVLYGAWWPFVQATAVDVQFTAAAAIADYLREQVPPVPAS
jgi:hypothetical protein